MTTAQTGGQVQGGETAPAVTPPIPAEVPSVRDRVSPTMEDAAPRRRAGREEKLFQEVNVDKVFTRLEELEKGNFDEIVTPVTFNYSDRGTVIVGGEHFSFTDYSFKQLATIIGIPSAVLQRSPLGGGRASRQSLVTHWMEQQEGRTFLLRLKRSEVVEKGTDVVGRVRGILPAMVNGDLPFSNKALLEALVPYLRAYNMGVQLGAANECSFHLRALFREEVNVGTKEKSGFLEIDRHCLGVHFVNSEVGKFPLRADLLVYRQVCKNGMIAQSERSGLIHKAHRFIDPTTIGAEIQQAMEAVRSRQDELLGGLRSLRDQRIDDPEAEIKAHLQEHKAPKEWIEYAIQSFAAERIGTRFGVLQAMTRAAQKVLPDLRIEFETIAGAYMLRHAVAY